MFCDIKDKLDDPSILKIMAYSEYEESLARAVERAKAHRSDDAQLVYGWVEDNVILGVCAFRVLPDRVSIGGISVAQNARGQGIGGAMVAGLQRMYPPLPIEAETDDDAVEFYRRRGFAVSELAKEHDNCRWVCILSALKKGADAR